MKRISKKFGTEKTKLARGFTGLNNNNKQTKVNAYV